VSQVVKHPATLARERESHRAFSEAWRSYMHVRRQADVVRDMALLGMIVANFTREEFETFTHLLSPHEIALAEKVWPSEAGKDRS
jgi:hypothetical protein